MLDKKVYKKVTLLCLLSGGTSVPFKILLFKYKCSCLQNIYKFRLVPHILKHNSYLVATVNKNSNNCKKAPAWSGSTHPTHIT